MKIRFIFALGVYICNAYPMQVEAYKVEPCNKATDLEAVVQMISTNDDDDYFIPIATSRKEKAQCMREFFAEPTRKNFIIRNEEGAIIGCLTFVKRRSPSRESVEELDDKYRGYKQMLLSWPDLPATSSGFILIVSVIVAKSERGSGKGIGRKLLEYAQQEALKDPTIEAIAGSVAIDNLPTIKLCESLGGQELFRNEELGRILFRKEVRHMNTSEN